MPSLHVPQLPHVFLVLLLATPGVPAGQGISGADAQRYLDVQVATVDLYNGGQHGHSGFGAYDQLQSVDPFWSGFAYPNLHRNFFQTQAWWMTYQDNHSIGQSRAIYVNAVTHSLLGVGDSRFREFAQRAGDFLIAVSWDDEPQPGMPAGYGGWLWGIQADGANPPTHTENIFGPKPDAKPSYGQNHAILALAHSYAATGDRDHYAHALQGWTHYKATYGEWVDGFPGAFRGDADRAFTTFGPRNLDYVLHALEAALALHGVADSDDRPALAQDVRDVGEHVVLRMVQDDPTSWNGAGYTRALIPYWFESDWTPDASGNFVSPGHQFEYAILLSKAVEAGLGDPGWLDAAEKLLEHPLFHTYDPFLGTVDYHRYFLDGDPYRAGKRVEWWHQVEAARALAHWAIRRDRADLWDEFQATMAMVEDHLTDAATNGGLFALLDPDTLQPNLSGTNSWKGQPWKAYYHGTALYAELIRLRAPDPRRRRLDPTKRP